MPDSPNLTGRTALVTGATAGIGLAAALELAAHGADVVVHGRHPRRGAEVLDEIIRRGGRGRFVAADLANAGEAARLAAEAGDVDILVNNAGIDDFSPTAATSVDSFDRQFAINTRAPFLLVGALAPAMARRGYGSIVNITSTAATSPVPVGGAYGASKAAIELLSWSWSTEFGGSGFRVNGVSPGPVRTAGTTQMLGDNIEALSEQPARGARTATARTTRSPSSRSPRLVQRRAVGARRGRPRYAVDGRATGAGLGDQATTATFRWSTSLSPSPVLPATSVKVSAPTPTSTSTTRPACSD